MMKKAIVLFLVVFVLLSVVTVPAYAEYFPHFPDIPDDAYSYWVIVDREGSSRLYSSESPFQVEKSTGELVTTGSARCYILQNGEWDFTANVNSGWSTPFARMYVSNHDVPYDDGSGFFFSVLLRTMTLTDFWAILRNFSAGLIPVIGCLILVISLRKGWEFLRSQLTT